MGAEGRLLYEGMFGRGHRVRVSFEEDQDNEPYLFPGKKVQFLPRYEATVAKDGKFTLNVPPEVISTKRPATVEILAPTGETMASYKFQELPAELKIPCIPKPQLRPSQTIEDRLKSKSWTTSTGRVLDRLGVQRVTGVQVIFLAVPDSGDQEVVVGVVRADSAGYFSMETPPGSFKSAKAFVGIGKGITVPVSLEAAEIRAARHKFPRNVILIVDLPEGYKTTDSETPGAIEEFNYYQIIRTTDPVIQGVRSDRAEETRELIVKTVGNLLSGGPALAGLPGGIADKGRKVPSTPEKRIVARKPTQVPPPGGVVDKTAGILRLLFGQPIGRDTLTATNPVDWDDTPTFYQATTIAHGHILHFKQTWRPDGYSQGDILYSLPLAPGQKKQIAIVDWERREETARTEATDFEERLEASLARDRDVSEVVGSMLTETVDARSSAATWSSGGGIGIALGPVVIGASGGAGGATSTAWQSSSRQLGASSLQQLRDRTNQAASAVRSTRSTVVNQVRQGEMVRAQTEVVANHNHSHALTIYYYEVLRHLQVTQDIADVQECLFIPLFLSEFKPDKALRWRHALLPALRDRRLSGGFDALERIANAYEGSDLPDGSYADENLERLEGHLYLRIQLARPRDDDKGAFNSDAWQFLEKIFPAISAREFHGEYIEGQSTRDRMFQKHLAPKIAEALVSRLQFSAVDKSHSVKVPLYLDATLASQYAPDGEHYVTLRMKNNLPHVARRSVWAIEISAGTDLREPLRQLLPAGSRVLVSSGALKYRTKHFEHDLFRSGAILNDLAGYDPVRIETPISIQELRNPREEDKEISARLLAHLNENLEYYHHAIWMRMDSDRRFMLLDGFVAPNAGGRSVASVVENRLIGIVGNSLVMPVARGYTLDPNYAQGDDTQSTVDLLHHYAPNTPIPPIRVSLPTRGVFAEAVLGSSNASEKIDDTRLWRWEESPIDEPTGIEVLSTASRRSEPAEVGPTPPPQPIVAFQNVPNAPDPTGLAAAIQALSTPGIFKDLTGLEGNQRNALAAYQAALETSKFFGGEAAKLEMQRRTNSVADRNLDRIQNAKKEGTITEDQANQLTMDLLRNAVGSSPNSSGPLTDVAEVKQVLKKGAEAAESSVKLSRPSGEQIEVTRSSAKSGSGATRILESIDPSSVTSVETVDADGSRTSVLASSVGKQQIVEDGQVKLAETSSDGEETSTSDTGDALGLDAKEYEWGRNDTRGYILPTFPAGEGADQDSLILWNFGVGSDDLGRFVRESDGLPVRLRMLKEWDSMGDLLDIRGFASRSGLEESNQALSERRAQRVKDWLVQVGGLNADRIETRGFGAMTRSPETYNTFDPLSRAKNRAVEIRRRKVEWSEGDYETLYKSFEHQNKKELPEGLRNRNLRLMNVLELMQNPSSDDTFVEGKRLQVISRECFQNINNETSIVPGYEWVTDVEEWEAHEIIKRLRVIIKTWHPALPQERLMSMLIGWDDSVKATIEWVQEKEGYGIAFPVLLLKAKSWMLERIPAERESIYQFYLSQ